MSSYKPKKLDELNKIYDKTVSAQRAIQKGASKIKPTEEAVAQESEQKQPIDNFIEEIKKSKPQIDSVVVKNPMDTNVSVKINVKKINTKKSTESLFEQSYLQELAKKTKEAEEADELAKQEAFAIEEAKRLQGDVVEEPEERESQEELLSNYLEIMSSEEKANKSFSLFKRKKKSKHEDEPITISEAAVEDTVQEEPVADSFIDTTAIEEEPVTESFFEPTTIEEEPVAESFIDTTVIEEEPVVESFIDTTAIEEEPVAESFIETTTIEEEPIVESFIETAAIEEESVVESFIDTTVIEEEAVVESFIETIAIEEEPVVESFIETIAIEEEPVVESFIDTTAIEEEPVAESFIATTVIEEEPVVESLIDTTVIEEEPVTESFFEPTVIKEEPIVESLIDTTVIEEEPVAESFIDTTVIEEEPVVESLIDTTVIEEEPVVESFIETTVIEEEPVAESFIDTTTIEEEPVAEIFIDTTTIEEEPVAESFIETTVIEEEPVVESFIDTTVIEEEPVVESFIETAAIEEEPVVESLIDTTVIEEEPAAKNFIDPALFEEEPVTENLFEPIDNEITSEIKPEKSRKLFGFFNRKKNLNKNTLQKTIDEIADEFIAFEESNLPVEEVAIIEETVEPIEEVAIIEETVEPVEEVAVFEETVEPIEEVEVFEETVEPVEEVAIIEETVEPVEEVAIIEETVEPVEEVAIIEETVEPVEEVAIFKEEVDFDADETKSLKKFKEIEIEVGTIELINAEKMKVDSFENDLDVLPLLDVDSIPVERDKLEQITESADVSPEFDINLDSLHFVDRIKKYDESFFGYDEVESEEILIDPADEIISVDQFAPPVSFVPEIVEIPLISKDDDMELDFELAQELIEQQEQQLKEIEAFLNKQATLDGEFEDVSSFSQEQLEQETVVAKKGKRSTVPLIILMSFSIILIMAVGVLNSLFSIDSNILYDNTFFVNVANQDYSDLDLNNGDLVFSTPVASLSDDCIFSYVDNSGTYLFAKNIGELIDESGNIIVKAQANLQTIYIEQSSVKGELTFSIPVLGAIVLLIQANFMIVMIVLTVLVLIMLLALCFGFKKDKKSKKKSKENNYNDDFNQEDYSNKSGSLKFENDFLFDLDSESTEEKELEFEDLNSFSN